MLYLHLRTIVPANIVNGADEHPDRCHPENEAHRKNGYEPFFWSEPATQSAEAVFDPISE